MVTGDREPDDRYFGASLPTDGPDEIDRQIAELLTLLGKKHSLAILALFAADAGPWRFGEIQDLLDVSPDTLSSRLSEFDEFGLVDRRSYHENPPRVEYTATTAAEGLRPVFRELYEWEDRRETPV